jgi:hypothetical protein
MLYEQRLHRFIDMVDENIEATSMQEVMMAFTEKREVEPSFDSGRCSGFPCVVLGKFL